MESVLSPIQSLVNRTFLRLFVGIFIYILASMQAALHELNSYSMVQ